ncbi:MAG: YlxR family protein [Anaerolineales bacterium]|nr:YlxR family protein [Anaerolineales bacterium]
MARQKHKPQRMCVACRQSQDKKSLVRIVRTQEGVYVDETGKLSGRGAYLHADPSCWEIGLKKSLERALKTSFTEQDRDRLLQYQDILSGQTLTEADQE